MAFTSDPTWGVMNAAPGGSTVRTADGTIDAVAKLDENENDVVVLTHSAGRPNPTSIVSEAGPYNLSSARSISGGGFEPPSVGNADNKEGIAS
jgi:hypothetical protein